MDREHFRERAMVEGFYAKYPEPALESCMKIQRSTGVNGKRSGMQLHS